MAVTVNGLNDACRSPGDPCPKHFWVDLRNARTFESTRIGWFNPDIAAIVCDGMDPRPHNGARTELGRAFRHAYLTGIRCGRMTGWRGRNARICGIVYAWVALNLPIELCPRTGHRKRKRWFFWPEQSKEGDR